MVCHKGVSFRGYQDRVSERMAALGRPGWRVTTFSLMSFPTEGSLTSWSLLYPENVQRSHSEQECHLCTPHGLSVKPQPCFPKMILGPSRRPPVHQPPTFCEDSRGQGAQGAVRKPSPPPEGEASGLQATVLAEYQLLANARTSLPLDGLNTFCNQTLPQK